MRNGALGGYKRATKTWLKTNSTRKVSFKELVVSEVSFCDILAATMALLLRPALSSSIWDPFYRNPLDVFETLTSSIPRFDSIAGLEDISDPKQGKYGLKFHVPNGLSPEDLKVTIDEDRLCLDGEHRTDHSYRRISQQISLPSDVDRNSIKCTFDSDSKDLVIEGTVTPSTSAIGDGQKPSQAIENNTSPAA